MLKVQNTFKIVSNEKISSKFRRMEITGDVKLSSFRPGQFVHVRVNEGLEPFFRRPFSVSRTKKHLEIFYEAVGYGTEILASKQKGSIIDVLGPLGTGFSMPPKGVKQVVMIAGGIGIAPFLMLSDKLKDKGYELVVIYGGRTKGHTFNMKAFKDNGCKVYVSTDDGSVGVKGNVSKLFSKIKIDPKTTFIYTCGPKPMMSAVQSFAVKNGLRGEASLEEVMACGTGTCLGCAIETVDGFKTVCHDGSVFGLGEIIL